MQIEGYFLLKFSGRRPAKRVELNSFTRYTLFIVKIHFTEQIHFTLRSQLRFIGSNYRIRPSVPAVWQHRMELYAQQISNFHLIVRVIFAHYIL